MKKLLLGIVSLFITNQVFAEESCEKFTTSYDRTYCVAKLFVESDNELNQVYKELKTYLKSEISKSLTTTQRNWIKYRDNRCETNGNIEVDCNYQVNKLRTEYLRDRLRECKTGNCQIDAIRRESW
ncbi:MULTISPECIES: lysozyme inhibitor LprI family protein [Mannheimia]|uniref:DUF1311 domain-containing protein n=1 Tax=Mannheimia pernigra TaxID=111844 RepID=A0A7H8UL80_9PAST|nr:MULTISPECIES: lysozyme inhibitor LprI family protein [Mannheimia]QLB39461.1 DUF1311 domain-containing protein [Mannheimia pernigra]QLB41414.1 DUF1311 domain-containing protein [Mannheimia pernigra]QLB43339.1 DUF1311 domain-containing protein [Mannheimia pernigra]QTM01347.1 DUF1311 domain-containing protein [Mannheimia sp. ZY171111]